MSVYVCHVVIIYLLVYMDTIHVLGAHSCIRLACMDGNQLMCPHDNHTSLVCTCARNQRRIHPHIRQPDCASTVAKAQPKTLCTRAHTHNSRPHPCNQVHIRIAHTNIHTALHCNHSHCPLHTAHACSLEDTAEACS